MALVLFGIFPYVALAVAVAGTVRRFGALRDTVTAGSSQLLESRLQRWGSVSFHYAILLVLLLHLGAIFLPGVFATLLSSPARLVIVEVTGLALGLTALAGLLLLVARRFALRAVTTWVDGVVLLLLLVQIATGVWTAATARWGYAWFGPVATAWLASLVRLSPRTDLLATLPLPFQVHAVNACLLLALVPWTRLAHVVVAPVEYLWRRPLVMAWRRAPSARHEVTR